MRSPPGTSFDIVLAGIGGQGVLMAAGILGEAALREGLTVRQGEIHGMSQRGGAVRATLRMAEGPVLTDLVSRGGASLLLALEPVVDAGPLAREAGSARAENVVVLGAVAHLLPFPPDPLRGVVADAFRPRGDTLVETNLRASDAGRAAVVASHGTT